MCKFSSKSGGVPFQPLGDLTWNDPAVAPIAWVFRTYFDIYRNYDIISYFVRK